MNYTSPIELIMDQMNLSIEEEIYKAVKNVGVNVDKEELLKALQYDRNQYQKGYSDRDEKIVRCKDCIHAQRDTVFGVIWCDGRTHDADWFCADGDRK